MLAARICGLLARARVMASWKEIRKGAPDVGGGTWPEAPEERTNPSTAIREICRIPTVQYKWSRMNGGLIAAPVAKAAGSWQPPGGFRIPGRTSELDPQPQFDRPRSQVPLRARDHAHGARRRDIRR